MNTAKGEFMKLHPNRSGLSKRLAKAFANELLRDKNKRRRRTTKKQPIVIDNRSTKEKMKDSWNNIGTIVAFIILMSLIIKIVDGIKLIFHID